MRWGFDWRWAKFKIHSLKRLHSRTQGQHWQLLFVLHALLFRNYGHYLSYFKTFNYKRYAFQITSINLTMFLSQTRYFQLISCYYLSKERNYLSESKLSIPLLSNLHILFSCQVRNLRLVFNFYHLQTLTKSGGLKLLNISEISGLVSIPATNSLIQTIIISFLNQGRALSGILDCDLPTRGHRKCLIHSPCHTYSLTNKCLNSLFLQPVLFITAIISF